MNPRSSMRRLAAALPAVLVLAACAGEETTSGPNPLSPAFITTPTPVRNQIVVCKAGSDATFDVTFTGNTSQTSLTDGQCQTVVTYAGGFREWVSVNELVPANTVLDSIVVETAYGCTASTCTISYDTTVVTGTTTAGAWVGLEFGAVITYYNTFTPPPPPPGGGEGCTPGYWKQSQHFDSWVGYTPGQTFSSAFNGSTAFGSMTLLQVLNLGGGGLNALGRHAVAALLNSSSSVDYDLDTAGVIAAFAAAVASGDYETQKDIFAGFNEQGCPLN